MVLFQDISKYDHVSFNQCFCNFYKSEIGHVIELWSRISFISFILEVILEIAISYAFVANLLTWSKLCNEVLAVKSELSVWDPLWSLLRLCFPWDRFGVILAKATSSGNNLNMKIYYKKSFENWNGNLFTNLCLWYPYSLKSEGTLELSASSLMLG